MLCVLRRKHSSRCDVRPHLILSNTMHASVPESWIWSNHGLYRLISVGETKEVQRETYPVRLAWRNRFKAAAAARIRTATVSWLGNPCTTSRLGTEAVYQATASCHVRSQYQAHTFSNLQGSDWHIPQVCTFINTNLDLPSREELICTMRDLMCAALCRGWGENNCF